MSQPIHQEPGRILVSLKISPRQHRSTSPARSNARRILFSVLENSSYPSGLFFVQMPFGINSMAR